MQPSKKLKSKHDQSVLRRLSKPVKLSRRPKVQSQELNQQELELALKVLWESAENDEPLLLVPPELKHLKPLDWEILSGFLSNLQDERESHSLQ